MAKRRELSKEDIDGAPADAARQTDRPSGELEGASPAPEQGEAGRASDETAPAPDTRVDSAGRPFDEAAAAMAEALAAEQAAAVPPPGASAMPLAELVPGLEDTDRRIDPNAMDMLADVNLNVRIELGRTRMMVEDVLRLMDGSVIELDKAAGDPVDVFVNERLVARGEVLVLSDNFCVRISEIVANLSEKVAV